MPGLRSRLWSACRARAAIRGQFARDLIAHLRQLLVARATGEVPESFTVTVAQPERLAGQAKEVDDAKLVGAIDALSAAVAAMREGDDPRLTLEVALLKVTTPSLDSSREALLRRIESLESRLTGEEAPAQNPKPPSRSSRGTSPNRGERRHRDGEIEQVSLPGGCRPPAGLGLGDALVAIRRGEAAGIDEERTVLRIGFPGRPSSTKKAESPPNVERMTEARRNRRAPTAPGLRADRRAGNRRGRRRGLARDERG